MTDRNDRRPTERRAGEGVRIIGADEAQRILDSGPDATEHAWGAPSGEAPGPTDGGIARGEGIGAAAAPTLPRAPIPDDDRRPSIFPAPPPPRPVPLASDQSLWAPETEAARFGTGGTAPPSEPLPAEPRSLWGPPLPGDDGSPGLVGLSGRDHGPAGAWPDRHEVSAAPVGAAGPAEDEIDDAADTAAFAYAGPGTRGAEVEREGSLSVSPGRGRLERDRSDQPGAGGVRVDARDRSAGPADRFASDEPSGFGPGERGDAHPTASVDEPDEISLTDEPRRADTPERGPRRRPSRAREGLGAESATSAAEDTGATAAVGRRSGRRRPAATEAGVGSGGSPGAGSAHNLRSRLLVGAALAVLLIVAYAIGPRALVVLAAVVVLLCAAEAYSMLQRCGFRPATLLGLAATGGLMFAGYWRGEPALPLVVALAFAGTMVWYLVGIVDARPLANVAVTSMAILWVGLLGSFAALLLRVQHGKGLFLGAVVVTVASDIVAYFGGRRWGRHPLAPRVSPGKTVEGFLAGAVAAVVVGLIIGHWVTPWGGIRHGLLLGVVVAILAPVGDLFESLIKRDLEVKDSGTVLAGHGGLLDRFDSLLLVLPATYYLADYLHLVR